MINAIPSPREVVRDPELFARIFLKIQNKEMVTLPLIYKPEQREYMRNRTSRDIILKPRQIGFSTCIQGDLCRIGWTRPSRSLTLTKDDANTKYFRAMSRFFYNNLPPDFRPTKKADNEVMTEYPIVQSFSIIQTAGNKNAGRSGTFTHIHFSEAAFVSEAEMLIASALQAGSPKWVVVESTPNGAQGWFYEQCMKALDGDSAFKLHFFPWFSSAEYRIALSPDEHLEYTSEEEQVIAKYNLTPEQIKWRRDKIKELGIRLFIQEYPEDPRSCFLTSGDGYFATIPHLADVFTAPSDSLPQPGRSYVAGLDLGQSTDFTVLSIMDQDNGIEVDLMRVNKRPWDDIWREVAQKCKQWGVKSLVVETNTLGGVDLSYVWNALSQHGSGNTSVVPFTTTAISKPPLIAGLYQGMNEHGLRLLADPVGRQEIYSFVTVQSVTGAWKYQAAAGAHDDTVIARALAWYGIVSADLSRLQFFMG